MGALRPIVTIVVAMRWAGATEVVENPLFLPQAAGMSRREKMEDVLDRLTRAYSAAMTDERQGLSLLLKDVEAIVMNLTLETVSTIPNISEQHLQAPIADNGTDCASNLRTLADKLVTFAKEVIHAESSDIQQAAYDSVRPMLSCMVPEPWQGIFSHPEMNRSFHEHRDCRLNEYAACNETACKTFDQFVHNITSEDLGCAGTVQAADLITDLEVMNRRMTERLRQYLWYKEACEHDRSRCAELKDSCRDQQILFETTVCGMLSRNQILCDDYTYCLDTANCARWHVSEGLKQRENNTKSQFVILTKIQCWVDLYIEYQQTRDRSLSARMEHCQNMEVNTSSLDIRYPAELHPYDCGVDHFVTPGTAKFNEYIYLNNSIVKWDNVSHLHTQCLPSETGHCPYPYYAKGRHNANVVGCGLTGCDDRYGLSNISQCAKKCNRHDGCRSFTWAPLNGDQAHYNQTVCTLYDAVEPWSYWGPDQIFCVHALASSEDTPNATATVLQMAKTHNAD